MTNSSDIQYPHAVLTSIDGEPTPPQLRRLTEEVIANFGAVYSRPNGTHGLMGEVLSADEYNELSPETPYVKPTHPGDTPTTAANQQALLVAITEYEHRLKA